MEREAARQADDGENLVPTLRRPFDLHAGGLLRPQEENRRSDWRSFQPSPEVLAPITGLFLGPLEPHPITMEQLMQRSA
jgi:hypothetical protein